MLQLLGIHVAVELIVKHQRWGMIARAKAGDREQGQPPVRRGLSQSDAAASAYVFVQALILALAAALLAGLYPAVSMGRTVPAMALGEE